MTKNTNTNTNKKNYSKKFWSKYFVIKNGVKIQLLDLNKIRSECGFDTKYKSTLRFKDNNLKLIECYTLKVNKEIELYITYGELLVLGDRIAKSDMPRYQKNFEYFGTILEDLRLEYPHYKKKVGKKAVHNIEQYPNYKPLSERGTGNTRKLPTQKKTFVSGDATPAVVVKLADKKYTMEQFESTRLPGWYKATKLYTEMGMVPQQKYNHLRRYLTKHGINEVSDTQYINVISESQKDRNDYAINDGSYIYLKENDFLGYVGVITSSTRNKNKPEFKELRKCLLGLEVTTPPTPEVEPPVVVDMYNIEYYKHNDYDVYNISKLYDEVGLTPQHRASQIRRFLTNREIAESEKYHDGNAWYTNFKFYVSAPVFMDYLKFVCEYKAGDENRQKLYSSLYDANIHASYIMAQPVAKPTPTTIVIPTDVVEYPSVIDQFIGDMDKLKFEIKELKIAADKSSELYALKKSNDELFDEGLIKDNEIETLKTDNSKLLDQLSDKNTEIDRLKAKLKRIDENYSLMPKVKMLSVDDI